MGRGSATRADGRPIVLAGLPDGAVENDKLRWKHGAGFHLPSGQRVHIVSLSPLHYQDAAEWQEYDLRFEPESGIYAHRLRLADFDLRIAARANAQQLLRLECSSGRHLRLKLLDLVTHQPGTPPQIATVGAATNATGQGVRQGDEELTRVEELHFPAALGVGRDLILQPREQGLSKRVMLATVPPLPGVIADVDTLRLRWLCNTNLTPRIDGVEWSGELLETESPIELVADGQVYWSWARPTAVAANGKRCYGCLAITSDGGHFRVEALFPLTWIRDAIYPVMLDPDTYYGEDTDGEIYGDDLVYATAQSTADAIYGGAANFDVGQTTDYWVMRSFMEFDTSGIAADQIVTKLTLTMTVGSDDSGTDFDVLIHKYDWASPLVAGNMEANYDGLLAATAGGVVWRNTSGMDLLTPYVSPALDTSWIDPAGMSRYGLISSRDIAVIQPSEDEYINIFSQTAGVVARRPYLTIYTAPKAALHPRRFGWQYGGLA